MLIAGAVRRPEDEVLARFVELVKGALRGAGQLNGVSDYAAEHCIHIK